MWGSELALAGATATLRIAAGRHYPSDVLVGVAAGAAFGLGVPLLHGYRDVPAGFGSDVVWGLGGLGVGVLASGGAAALGAFDEDPHVDVFVTNAGGAPVATLRGRF